jgi:hypothetical protein
MLLPLLHPEFATQSPLVTAFMDRCEEVSDGGALRLVGWALSLAGSTARPVRFVSSVGTVEHLDPVLRRDVAQAHGGAAALDWCGWDQEVPVPRATGGSAAGVLEMLIPGEPVWLPFMQIAARDGGGGGGLLKEAAATPEPQQSEEEEMLMLGALRSVAPLPSVVVVDDVYADPHAVRAFALSQEFRAHPEYHRGERTEQTFLFPGIKELFERALLGRRICEKDWHAMGTNGCFQWCKAGDSIVYHADMQQMAGVIFLTPDAPPECGTSLFRSRGPCHARRAAPGVFDGGFLDASRFERVDAVGNVFNRLVLFDAQLLHAASQYFGTDATNGRLFQMFFFNLECE